MEIPQQFIGYLFSGVGIISLLLIWFLVETLLILFKNFEFLTGKFGKDEKNIVSEVQRYSTKALNLAAITFAASSLIIAGFGLDIILIEDTLLVFVFGLSLFIISYKLEVFATVRRLYWSLQQRLTNFGVLSLVFGFLLFFKNHFPQSYLIVLFMTFGIVFIHIKEYIADYKYYTHEKQRQ